MAGDGGSLSEVTSNLIALFSDNPPTIGWGKGLEDSQLT